METQGASTQIFNKSRWRVIYIAILELVHGSRFVAKPTEITENPGNLNYQI